MGIVNVSIPMMESNVQELRVIESKEFGCLVLELPTSILNLALYVFLPHTARLSKVEEIFGRKHYNEPFKQSPRIAILDNVITQMEETPKTAQVKVYMPRYTINY